jgi:hypothetical protein
MLYAQLHPKRQVERRGRATRLDHRPIGPQAPNFVNSAITTPLINLLTEGGESPTVGELGDVGVNKKL